MSNTVIRVENLSKNYRLGLIGMGTLQDDIARKWAKLRGKPDPLINFGQEDHGNLEGEFIWALRSINFEVKQGEILGLIGKNGAGKTTLLKILGKITAPTEGRAMLKGRLGCLIAVGTGFHPELTGRENIYLNGAILGMKKYEIDRKLDEIVDFSGIEKFIDTPVKRYSSGMNVRLGFAVAAHLEPEILLVDEVLAVGDYKFREKCLGKMEEITSKGRTVIFVSHNMKAISTICPRTILIDNGQIAADGNTSEVIMQYKGDIREECSEVTWTIENAPGNHSVRLLGICTLDEKYNIKAAFKHNEPIDIEVTFQVMKDKVDLFLRMYIENEDGVDVLVITELKNTRFNKGQYKARFNVKPHVLNEGHYRIQQILFKEGQVTSTEDVARVEYPVSFQIDYLNLYKGEIMTKTPGVIRPDWEWDIKPIMD